MRLVYICNAVPEQVNDRLSRSVAGNKFSLNMAKELNKLCGDKLTFITTDALNDEMLACCAGEIWPGKQLTIAKRGRGLAVNEFVLRRNLLNILRKLRREHPDEEITVFVENAPFAAATACAAAKKRLRLSCFSITIDTPFTGAFRGTGIAGRINSWLFRRGWRALKRFDGLVSFTRDVEQELGVDIPFCDFAIGCPDSALPDADFVPRITPEKTAVYAGTLIYYNGINELLEAYAQLGEEYRLHIYGYGPLEDAVKRAAAEHENIVFHGRFDPADTARILSGYNLLINPRQIDPTIENFTFPSKLVDYILTGKSVLTSDFKTLPPQYRQFLYLLEDMTPSSIAKAVKDVFDDEMVLRQERGLAGIEYIRENQTYQKIAEKIAAFSIDSGFKQ